MYVQNEKLRSGGAHVFKPKTEVGRVRLQVHITMIDAVLHEGAAALVVMNLIVGLVVDRIREAVVVRRTLAHPLPVVVEAAVLRIPAGVGKEEEEVLRMKNHRWRIKRTTRINAPF